MSENLLLVIPKEILRTLDFPLAVVILLILLISYRKFHFSKNPLSRKAKIFLIIMAIIFAVPTISIICYKYIEAATTDYGYAKTQSQVTYHIYKASNPPNGLIQIVKFTTGAELAGRNDAVKVFYGRPIGERFKTGKPSHTGIRQVGVDADFQLDDFAAAEAQKITNSALRQIILSKAKGEKAYLIERQIGTSTGLTLAYVTEDSVLIVITGLNSSPEEFVQLAESLK